MDADKESSSLQLCLKKRPQSGRLPGEAAWGGLAQKVKARIWAQNPRTVSHEENKVQEVEVVDAAPAFRSLTDRWTRDSGH